MEFPVKEALGAATTLAVTAVGYFQWSRTRQSNQFIADRQAAYRAVWDALEEANLAVRAGSEPAPEALDARERALNALLMKHGLHLDDADRLAARRYARAILALGRLLGSERGDELFTRFRRDMGRTEDPADGVWTADLVAEAGPVLRELEQSRAAVVARFRDALGARHA